MHLIVFLRPLPPIRLKASILLVSVLASSLAPGLALAGIRGYTQAYSTLDMAKLSIGNFRNMTVYSTDQDVEVYFYHGNNLNNADVVVVAGGTAETWENIGPYDGFFINVTTATALNVKVW